jgi:hypothetical protein
VSLDVESRLALDEDEAAVFDFLTRHDGAVTTDTADAAIRWLILHPRSAPTTETYFVRLRWTSYPHAAPSVVFATAVGGQTGISSAWPQIPGYRPPHDICMPFTAEGLALHSEWASGPDAWTAIPNPYLRVVTQLQDDLDNRYAGRAA